MTTAIVNPTILLESANFTKMLDYCKERFAYILVDMPPLASVADALNTSSVTVTAACWWSTAGMPRKVVDNSVQMLWRTETPLLGIVLNRADVRGERRGVPDRLQLRVCDDHGPGTGAGLSL